MNLRVKISIVLVCLGIIIALLPQRENNAASLNPSEVLNLVSSYEKYFSVDQVARFVVNEDTSIMLVDLRTPEEYVKCNIPGSVNIPVRELLNKDYEGYLKDPVKKTILYSNGDVLSSQAWLLAQRVGFKNTWVMKGGMNEWFRTVMLTEYSGNTISPSENAIFESRYKARLYFTQMNSLPDSAKIRFLAAKKVNEKKLVGGCE